MFEINETNGVYTVTGSGAFDELVNVIGVEAKSKLSTRGKITDANSAQSYLSAYMFPLKHEEFWVLYLDTQHNVLEVKKLFSGTIDAAPIYPREVVVDALRASAAAVIFAQYLPDRLNPHK
ncbi:JAB domain-containing protein [Shewanella sp. SG44-6]|uniref:JAB domain-containing protein n=1 Tax=Shewanella sp. SG44-6 TaxID=2760959 RepID=UPI0016031F6A|nr:JAB domain-containing protein [Shewanella sp. SG44-6]MBB1390803.1 JAB domain-containing protein [Shewanella sp. SG44-6]